MNHDGFASTPEPPYWTVIFTSLRQNRDDGYASRAERMLELARAQPGFLGVESAREADGKAGWYDTFKLRVAKVEEERVFGFPDPES